MRRKFHLPHHLIRHPVADAGEIPLIEQQRLKRLPHVALVNLVGFLAVRAISLHYIDAVLYRRSIGSIPFNAIAELGVTLPLALAAILAAVGPRRTGSG